MAKQDTTGIYQLSSGYWAYRYTITNQGKRKEVRKTKDELGNPLKTQKQAIAGKASGLEKRTCAQQSY